MKERIILDFLDYAPLKAEAMLGRARHFAVEKIGGRTGHGGSTVYAYKGWACVAYWTRARAVVVREIPNTLPTGAPNAAR